MNFEHVQVINLLADAMEKAYNLDQDEVVSQLGAKIIELLAPVKVTGEVPERETPVDNGYAAAPDKTPNEQFVEWLNGRCPCCILFDYVTGGEWDTTYSLYDFLYFLADIEDFNSIRDAIVAVTIRLQEDLHSLPPATVISAAKRLMDISNNGIELQRRLAAEGKAEPVSPIAEILRKVITEKTNRLGQ